MIIDLLKNNVLICKEPSEFLVYKAYYKGVPLFDIINFGDSMFKDDTTHLRKLRGFSEKYKIAINYSLKYILSELRKKDQELSYILSKILYFDYLSTGATFNVDYEYPSEKTLLIVSTKENEEE